MLQNEFVAGVGLPSGLLKKIKLACAACDLSTELVKKKLCALFSENLMETVRSVQKVAKISEL